MIKKIEVYDPPMCCSTGVCGPKVDKALPRFAADLEWLTEQGVRVSRFNLAQQAGAFTNNATVSKALKKDENVLPLILVGGKIVSCRKYPTRAELSDLLGLKVVVDKKAKTKKKVASGCKCCCC